MRRRHIRPPSASSQPPPPPDPNFDALLNILRRDLEENRFVKPQSWKKLGCTFFPVFPFSCLEEILPSEWLMLYYGRYIYTADQRKKIASHLSSPRGPLALLPALSPTPSRGSGSGGRVEAPLPLSHLLFFEISLPSARFFLFSRTPLSEYYGNGVHVSLSRKMRRYKEQVRYFGFRFGFGFGSSEIECLKELYNSLHIELSP